MSKLQNLYDKRADSIRTIEELRENMPDSGWEADEQTKFDKAYDDFKRYSKAIEDYKKSEKISEELDAEKLFEKENAKKGEQPKYKDVFVKWLSGDYLNSEEHDILKAGKKADDGKAVINETRALSSTVGAGGYTIPEEWEASLYKSMAWYGPFASTPGQEGQVGNIIMTPHGRKLNFPRSNDTSNTGRQLTEATGDASSGTTDPTFTEMELEAYKYTSDLIKVSSELIRDSNVNIGDELVRMLAERLGRIYASDLTNGTGNSKPQGIRHAATLFDATAATGAITRSEIKDLKYSVDRAYRNGPQVGWMLNDETVSYILGLDTSGSATTMPLWQPSFAQDAPDRILGDPYYVNNNLGTLGGDGEALILYGDFAKFYIRMVQGIRTAVARERYIENDVVAFVSFLEFDSDLIDTAAVKYLKEDAT